MFRERTFRALGLELEGETTVEGSWVDRVVGLDGVRADIAMMRTPDRHSRRELSKFHAPKAARSEQETHVLPAFVPTAPMRDPSAGDSVACTSQNAGVPAAGLAAICVAETTAVPRMVTETSALHASCDEPACDGPSAVTAAYRMTVHLSDGMFTAYVMMTSRILPRTVRASSVSSHF